MVKYKGKEITQEQFDKIITDADADRELAGALKDKADKSSENEEKLKELEDVKKALAASEEVNFKKTLSERTGQLTKWLGEKGNDVKIIDKLGKMSEDDFDMFKEGKVDQTYKTQDELNKDKADLETKKSEFESNKDKILREAKKELEKKNETKDDSAIIPNTETGKEGDNVEGNEKTNKFLDPKGLKKLYNLSNNPLYKQKEFQEVRAQGYLERNYGS